jgi:hypothetical protein
MGESRKRKPARDDGNGLGITLAQNGLVNRCHLNFAPSSFRAAHSSRWCFYTGVGQIVDLIGLDIERKRHIVADEIEA